MGNIINLMEKSMLENGKMGNIMGKESFLGLVGLFMKGNGRMGKEMVTERL